MKKTAFWKCLLAAVIAVWFFTAVGGIRGGSAQEGRRQLERALRRSVVACYAAEGRYPPDVAYLQAHYGVRIDESRYTVFYEVFAENLMPEIVVVEHEK